MAKRVKSKRKPVQGICQKPLIVATPFLPLSKQSILRASPQQSIPSLTANKEDRFRQSEGKQTAEVSALTLAPFFPGSDLAWKARYTCMKDVLMVGNCKASLLMCPPKLVRRVSWRKQCAMQNYDRQLCNSRRELKRDSAFHRF